MKRVWVLVIIAVVILGIIFIPRLFSNEGGNTVDFKVLSENEIPKKIKDVLPMYQTEERALACKVQKDIYVIVTRGEKKTAGYSVTIDKIEKLKKDDKLYLIVYAVYKDPKPDEIVAQVITYPTVVVKTELKDMPDKIQLKTQYEE